MRDANGFFSARITHYKICKKLSVLILIRVIILSLTLIIVEIIVAAHRAKTLAVSLPGILRFELRFLSRRNKMRVLFQVFDYLLGNNFTLEAAKRAFDRFIIIY